MFNVSPEPVTNDHEADRRVDEALTLGLRPNASRRTLRALLTYSPVTLRLLLGGLEEWPEPDDRDVRLGKLDRDKDRLVNARCIARPESKQRRMIVRHASEGTILASWITSVGVAKSDETKWRGELIATASGMLDDARERLVTIPRERRDGRKKMSARKRVMWWRALVDGLGWPEVEVARMILDSTDAWRDPPCPVFVSDYASTEAELLVDALRQSSKRSGRNRQI